MPILRQLLFALLLVIAHLEGAIFLYSRPHETEERTSMQRLVLTFEIEFASSIETTQSPQAILTSIPPPSRSANAHPSFIVECSCVCRKERERPVRSHGSMPMSAIHGTLLSSAC